MKLKLKRSTVVTGAVAAVVVLFLIGFGITGIKSGVKEVTKVKQPTSQSLSQEANLSSAAEQSDSGASKSSEVTSNGKVAYLTFDDGPSKLTPGLLQTLKENKVNATFFVISLGKDTTQKREWLKEEVTDGNVVGIHSWTHKYSYIYANEQNFLSDFEKIKEMIVSATGVEPTMMRFPGGIGNTVSIEASGGKIIMPKLVSDVEKMGVMPVDWNAGGEDAVSKVPTKDAIVKDVMSDCKGLKNVVILLHDSATHATSIEAVPEIIKELKAQGYTFETLSPQSKKVQENAAKSSMRYKHPTVVN